MAVKYMCPVCDAILRPSRPVPAGRKIRCPNCQSMFVPTASINTAPAPARRAAEPEEPGEQIRLDFSAARPKKKRRDQDEEEDTSPYRVMEEREPDEAEQEAARRRKKDLARDDFRDKFPKSKRGPAMAKVVRPANLILMQGVKVCIGAIVFGLWAVWPMIFTEEALPRDRVVERLMYLGAAVLIFAWGAFMCVGASKMQYLESYSWAMAGSILGLVPSMVGLWGILVLRDKDVIAGFEEGVPDYDPMKQKKRE